ncbi:hypothetical protein OpiT1DRAFT_03373 [Opitutaceae bacterium TAV1]|nr:hypothetical protein OpiT1DRAFT_03373 [Opitutaceae bacterium TAV1]
MTTTCTQSLRRFRECPMQCHDADGSCTSRPWLEVLLDDLLEQAGPVEPANPAARRGTACLLVFMKWKQAGRLFPLKTENGNNDPRYFHQPQPATTLPSYAGIQASMSVSIPTGIQPLHKKGQRPRLPGVFFSPAGSDQNDDANCVESLRMEALIDGRDVIAIITLAGNIRAWATPRSVGLIEDALEFGDGAYHLVERRG